MNTVSLSICVRVSSHRLWTRKCVSDVTPAVPQLVHEDAMFPMDPAVSICSRTISGPLRFSLQLFLPSANQLQAQTATPTETAGCASFSTSERDNESW